MNSSTSNSDPATALDREAGPGGAYLAWYLGTCVLVTILLVGFNFAVDPLQIYRRAGAGAVFSENQRYQNAGLARSYDYETVILGTSHAENFLPSHVDRILGERAVKLAVSGSTAHEQYLTLRLALATGKVRHVLWSLDYLSFRRPARATSPSGGPFPLHLYEGGARTAWLYLASLDSLGLSLDALLGRGHRDLDSLNAWHGNHEFGEARVRADWLRRIQLLDRIRRDPERPYTSTRAMVRRSVRRNLKSLVVAHPEVRFDLFFPPYSVLSYEADLRAWDQAFAERQDYKRFVVGSLAALPNVRIFDFQAEEEISHDFSRYKDLEHFDLATSDYILESIAADRHRVDVESQPALLARQAAQVERFAERACERRSVYCPESPGAR